MESNTDFSPEKRPMKERCRRIVVSFPPHQKTSILMMPSAHAFCVKEALESNLITTQTSCLMAERDASVFEQMKESCASLGLENSEYVRSSIAEVSLDRTYDFCFLDYCGPFMPADVQWIKKYLSGRLHEGSDIAITVYTAYRNSAFLKACHAFFRTTRVRQRFIYNLSIGLGIFDPLVLTYLAIISCCLSDKKMTIHALKYQDTNPMFTFLLKNIKTERSHIPRKIVEAFDRFVSEEINKRKCIMAKKSNMISNGTAARKAWETRRNASLAKKRSAAAHKAWETRRKQAAA